MVKSDIFNSNLMEVPGVPFSLGGIPRVFQGEFFATLRTFYLHMRAGAVVSIFDLFGETLKRNLNFYGRQISDSAISESYNRVELFVVYMIARFSGYLGDKKDLNSEDFHKRRAQTEKGLMPINKQQNGSRFKEAEWLSILDEDTAEWLSFRIITLCLFTAMQDETRTMLPKVSTEDDLKDWKRMCGKFIPKKYKEKWDNFSTFNDQFKNMQGLLFEQIGWKLNITSTMLWWSDAGLPCQYMPNSWECIFKGSVQMRAHLAYVEALDAGITVDEHKVAMERYSVDERKKSYMMERYSVNHDSLKTKRPRVCAESASSSSSSPECENLQIYFACRFAHSSISSPESATRVSLLYPSRVYFPKRENYFPFREKPAHTRVSLLCGETMSPLFEKDEDGREIFRQSPRL